MDIGRDDYFLAVIADADVANLADVHVLVADFGLVRFQAFGIFEADLDRGPLRNFFADDHETTDQHDHCRQYPYQRQTPPERARRHGCRQIIEIRRRSLAHAEASSHSSRSSNVRAANMVRTTTEPNANAPQPTET